MSFKINQDQFFHLSKPSRSVNLHPNAVFCIAVFILFAPATAWHYHQSQPLTDAQRATLASMVGETARKIGETRQKVWWRVKGVLGVRRIEEIERRDFDKAQELLIQGMR